MRDPIVVLKFGSSVLRDEAALPAAVLEIYREVRQGRRVVAVVSAFGSTTDTLLQAARKNFDEPDPRCLARLLETGEARAAAGLGLALAEVGLPTEILDPRQIDFLTTGPVLDAEPLGVDAAKVRATLTEVPVVIVPGFIGLDRAGRPTLLGRGGSDLTALFLAQRLGAEECRLLKDVNGLLQVRADGSLDHGTRYALADYGECLRVGGPLIQSKAVEFAAGHGMSFTIAQCGAREGTLAGPFPSRFEAVPPRPRRLRVALAGLGTVGLGVFRWLKKMAGDFRVTGILVRDTDIKRAVDVPRSLLVGSAVELLDRRPDLVIEVIGGTDTAAGLLHESLYRGIPVVSANKQLLALDPDLWRFAVGDEPEGILCSASVGGGMPALELAAVVAREEPVTSVQGVLNGTCNFILDRMLAGDTCDRALALAQERGLAEADPYLDISGLDCVYKLCLLATRVFGTRVDPDDVACRGLDRVGAARVRWARERGKVLKMVAEARRENGGIKASVGIRILDAGHPLAGCRGEENLLLIQGASGGVTRIAGKGAGRWPTTLAVISDALQVRRNLLGKPSALPDATATTP